MGKGYVFSSLNSFFEKSGNREEFNDTYKAYKSGDFSSFTSEDWAKANSGGFTKSDDVEVGYGQNSSSGKKRPRYQLYWKNEPRDKTKYKLSYVWIRNTGKPSRSKTKAEAIRSKAPVVNVTDYKEVK